MARHVIVARWSSYDRKVARGCTCTSSGG